MIRQTSLDALNKLIDSGKASTQRAKVLRAIIDNPGLTRAELSEKTGIRINAMCGRINELLTDKQIEEGNRRQCWVTGYQALTLKPVTEEIINEQRALL